MASSDDKEGTPSSRTPPPLTQANGTSARDELETYNLVAETVGAVPSLRWKDNVIQAVTIVSCTVVGALIGIPVFAWIADDWPWWMGACVGGVIGLTGSALLSGGVLMVLGWVRAVKARSSGNK